MSNKPRKLSQITAATLLGQAYSMINSNFANIEANTDDIYDLVSSFHTCVDISQQVMSNSPFPNDISANTLSLLVDNDLVPIVVSIRVGANPVTFVEYRGFLFNSGSAGAGPTKTNKYAVLLLSDNFASIAIYSRSNLKQSATFVSKYEFQEKLISGTNIKTFGNQSILGSGNIALKTVNGQSILGSGNLPLKTINSESLNGTGNIEFKTIDEQSILGSGNINSKPKWLPVVGVWGSDSNGSVIISLTANGEKEFKLSDLTPFSLGHSGFFLISLNNNYEHIASISLRNASGIDVQHGSFLSRPGSGNTYSTFSIGNWTGSFSSPYRASILVKPHNQDQQNRFYAVELARSAMGNSDLLAICTTDYFVVKADNQPRNILMTIHYL